MNIVFFEVEPWMQDYISPLLPGQHLLFTNEALTEASAPKYQDADIVSVFVFSKISSQVIELLPNLKLIAARSTGYDHIDLSFSSARNISVSNVPQYGSVTVAEHTWALILSLSRKIFESYDRTESANFSNLGLRGFDLYGKTLGLVGLGAIGRLVALMSRGFNMKLRVFNRTKDFQFAEQFSGFVYVDRVEDVYTHADVISLHVPLMPETHHLLNVNNYRHLVLSWAITL